MKRFLVKPNDESLLKKQENLVRQEARNATLELNEAVGDLKHTQDAAEKARKQEAKAARVVEVKSQKESKLQEQLNEAIHSHQIAQAELDEAKRALEIISQSKERLQVEVINKKDRLTVVETKRFEGEQKRHERLQGIYRSKSAAAGYHSPKSDTNHTTNSGKPKEVDQNRSPADGASPASRLGEVARSRSMDVNQHQREGPALPPRQVAPPPAEQSTATQPVPSTSKNKAIRVKEVAGGSAKAGQGGGGRLTEGGQAAQG